MQSCTGYIKPLVFRKKKGTLSRRQALPDHLLFSLLETKTRPRQAMNIRKCIPTRYAKGTPMFFCAFPRHIPEFSLCQTGKALPSALGPQKFRGPSATNRALSAERYAISWVAVKKSAHASRYRSNHAGAHV